MDKNYPDYRGEDLFNENQYYEKNKDNKESKWIHKREYWLV